MNTVYLWDSMEDQDRQKSLEDLRDKDDWVVWKTKDNKWTHELQQTGFHQLLSLDKNTQRTSGTTKSRDGGEEATSKPQNVEKKGNDG